LPAGAREDKVLELVNIKNTKHLISAFPDDADNLLVVLTSRQLNPNLIIVSRVSDHFNQSKLIYAGAKHVVMPDPIGRDHTGSLLVVPDLISIIDELIWIGD
jgi:voltage-gated potassium channel